jgi:HEAT repeat protein
MNATVQIKNLLNLRPGEAWTVGMLLLYSFFQSFALAIFLTAASAIFLVEFPIHNFPYLYVITSVVLLLVMFVYLKLEERLSFSNATLVEAVILVISVVLLRLALAYQPMAWMAFALMVWHRVMVLLTNSDLVRVSALLFDVRQSKRLFGVTGAGEMPASILGYLLATALVPFIGAPNLLWLSAGGFLLSLLCLSGLMNKKPEHFLDEEDESGSKAPMLKTLKNKFILLLCCTTFVSLVAAICIDFAFLSQVQTRFTSETQIVTFLGIFLGAGELVAFIVKTTLYGRLMSRFGIQSVLMVLPTILFLLVLPGIVLGFWSSSTSALLWIWVSMMFFSKTLRAAAYDSAFLTLLQPMQKKLRLTGHDILSFVEAIAVGISGLFLLWLIQSSFFKLSYVNVFLLPVLLGWLFSIVLVNRAYLQMLGKALANRLLRGSSLSLNDMASIELLRKKLDSHHPGEVLYAMNLLVKAESRALDGAILALLEHPVPEVRREALAKVERLRMSHLQAEVKKRIALEELPEIRKIAIRTYCALGESEVVDEIGLLLEHPDSEIRKGAMIGLIRWGGISGVVMAGQQLTQLIDSLSEGERALAAEIIGEVGIQRFYHPLLKLLADPSPSVRASALDACGSIKNPRLFPFMISALTSPQSEVASRSLVAAGESVISDFEAIFKEPALGTGKLRRLVHVAGRIGGPQAIAFLKERIYFTDVEIRNTVLSSLAICRYQAKDDEREKVMQIIRRELTQAAWFLNALEVLAGYVQMAIRADVEPLSKAIQVELNHLRNRLLFLLSFVFDSTVILQARDNLRLNSREKRANALEILDVVLPKDLNVGILPLLDELSLHEQAKQLQIFLPDRKLRLVEHLQQLLEEREPAVNTWTRATALFTIRQLSLGVLTEAVVQSLVTAVGESNELIAETAWWTLTGLHPNNAASFLPDSHEAGGQMLDNWLKEQKRTKMSGKLLSVEKVMTLKTISIFGETSEEVLVDIAGIVKEVSLKAGECVFEKNDPGTCMYVIYEGSVRVHDGDFTLAKLQNRDFFGELALLDPEPRSASVTALENTLLLRLDQSTFYEIMADRIEVAREIIKILCRRLRNQNKLLAALQQPSATEGMNG